MSFAGIPTYPFDPVWRLEAEWVALESPIRIDVPNVSGELKSITVDHKAFWNSLTKKLLDVPAAEVVLGRDRAAPQIYGWDNEFGRHEASTAAFRAARYLVSNREFLGFVEVGGYADDALWQPEGLAWRC